MVTPKIYLAADHAGFAVKEKIKSFLIKNNYRVEDCGAFEYDKDDDYPDFISKAAKGVSEDLQNSKAIILGGSGQAEMMVANKFKGVRCALFYGVKAPAREADITGRISADPYEIIRLVREHNDANILSLGVRFITDKEAIKAVNLWLETPFSGEERHKRRINKIKDFER